MQKNLFLLILSKIALSNADIISFVKGCHNSFNIQSYTTNLTISTDPIPLNVGRIYPYLPLYKRKLASWVYFHRAQFMYPKVNKESQKITYIHVVEGAASHTVYC